MEKIKICPPPEGGYPNGFYVYLHRKLTDLSVFYVGKGSGPRAWKPSGIRNNWWAYTARKHGVVVEIIYHTECEDLSFHLEKEEIARQKSIGSKLVNASLGGKGGSSGIRPANARNIFCSNGMIFSKSSEASDWLLKMGVKGCHPENITAAARGVHETAYGYCWWYEGEEPKPHIEKLDLNRKAFSKGVNCENGMFFNNMPEAVVWLKSEGHKNACNSGICRVINRENRTAYGYKWYR